MQGANKQEILLESGTNEMEIIEFFLGSQSFGINVQKLKEIVPYDASKVTVLPDDHPSVVGRFLIRGNTVNLIDLGLHLNRKSLLETSPDLRRVILVCEFNGRINSFLVDGVNQIHRINWKDVHPMSNFLEKYHPRFTGSIHIEGREVLITDLEHIIAEIDPEMKMAFESPAMADGTSDSHAVRRGSFHLMVAEDSSLIRMGIVKVLTEAGYSRLTTFVDGEECYNSIRALTEKARQEGEPVETHLRLVITDIEMPRMDGLTLCRRIREEMKLTELPVLIFSSLITEQMALKCQSVGANSWISKPQIPALVELVDGFCLHQGK